MPILIMVMCFLSLVTLLLIMSSCSNAEDEALSLDEIPDTTSRNFHQITVSPDSRVEINSALVDVYNEKNLTVFSHVQLERFDSEGTLALQGRAEHLEIDTDRNGTAKGNIFARDEKNQRELGAEHLIWTNADRRLHGEGVVTINSGDGLIMSGEGFMADMKRESYHFTDNVNGTLEITDDP